MDAGASGGGSMGGGGGSMGGGSGGSTGGGGGSTGSGGGSSDGGSSDGGSTTITFLHFNDLHAHLVPHRTLVANGSQPKLAVQGGVARLKSLIDQQRTAHPNSVLMNIGDTYHGGAEALYTQGEAVAPAVNALGIDVGVPGNWDYAYGPVVTRLRYVGAATSGLQECVALGFADAGGGGFPRPGGGGGLPNLTRPNFPMLAANVTWGSGPGVTVGAPFLPPTLVKEVGGVKVGFIGLSSDIVPRMHPMLACGLRFLGADELAAGDAAGWDAKYQALIEQHAAALRGQGAQVVVVMSELGVQKDKHLADVLPSHTIDVFFSAHTHETTFTPLVGDSGALVVEAGDDTWLGVMDLDVGPGGVTGHRWSLLPVAPSLPEDTAMAQLVAQARAPFLKPNPDLLIPGGTGAQLALTESIATTIGFAPAGLTRKNPLDSSFNRFFTAALRRHAGTDWAMSPGFRFDEPIPREGWQVEGSIPLDGRVTLEDAYRFFPVIYGMGRAESTGTQLQSVLERALTAVFSPSIPLQNGGWLEGFDGFSAKVKLAAPDGQRVLELRDPQGQLLSPTATYSIAGCRRPFDAAGILCSHEGFTNVEDLTNPDGGVVTNVQILREALESPASVPPPVFDDVSGTAFWPADGFVQPLEGVR